MAPQDKAQRNSADPESWLMKTRGGYIRDYNAQAAADADHQVIVALWLAAEGRDQMQLEPMIKAIEASAKRLPKELSADSGCCSERNLEILEDSGICGYVATGRQRHCKAAETGAKARREGTLREKMARRMETGGRNGPYRRRKITIEPVFGQIKQARRFRQFLQRGQRKPKKAARSEADFSPRALFLGQTPWAATY